MYVIATCKGDFNPPCLFIAVYVFYKFVNVADLVTVENIPVLLFWRRRVGALGFQSPFIRSIDIRQLLKVATNGPKGPVIDSFIAVHIFISSL